MNEHLLGSALAGAAVAATAFSSLNEIESGKKLRVVIIRHGEKPEADENGRVGDNLSCQGMNRALQLPNVLYQKFGKPDYTYVPSLNCSTSTEHARMFQTITPFAIKHDLTINSKFAEDDFENIAADVLQKTGTVLLVWEHSAIQQLARQLGAEAPDPWHGHDFDSIWIIDFKKGKAKLHFDQEGISPSKDCGF